jgi:hypothetical protein
MRIGGCAGVWLGLVLVSCGWMVASAQTVPTTNEVRAMRGLGPIEGSGDRDQGSGAKSAVDETAALVG